MKHLHTRREFLGTAAAGTALGLAGGAWAQSKTKAADSAAGGDALPKYPFKISLAGWSLHRTIGTGEGKVPMLDMPKMAAEEFGIGAIELVSGMLPETSAAYFAELDKNAAAHNVEILLIMIDGQGAIGARSDRARETAVERHSEWIDYAAGLGCHCVRMNWGGATPRVMTDEEELNAFIERSVPGFHALCDHAGEKGLSVTIENHGGPSSFPEPMQKLMAAVDRENFGTLPDFGNFPPAVDKYNAIDQLMPYAKAVSAKCYDFDETTGLETEIDFPRMMEIVCGKHGYDGWVGIEYEGRRMGEIEGIKAAKDLLARIQA